MMKSLFKPAKLYRGDTIATISPCNGWAGDANTRWKYKLGVKRLEDIGLNVMPAPHSLKGHDYLSKNPQARAEDIMWAFENKSVKAIIANVGGNDCIKVIPFINASCIKNNPKILIGYSDVFNLHMLCYQCGLSSFYGDNLLEPIAEAQGWHEYSKKWFEKVLFNNTPIGFVEPSSDWTFEKTNYTDPTYNRKYVPNKGYELIQGRGIIQGRLFGGNTGLMDLDGTCLALSADDFQGTILFIEDIPQFFTPESIGSFLVWLSKLGALDKLKGIVIGKASDNIPFDDHKRVIKEVLSSKPSLSELPVLYGLNFGHSSPMCVLPYGVEAEINCDTLSFSILESGVV